MTTGQFSSNEWKLLLNAPHWVYNGMIAADRGSISTRRTEAKALEEFLSGYRTRSPLVKEIIAGQEDADDNLKGSLEDAERMLGQVDRLLERKVGEDEGNAVRDLLTQAGEAIAKAAREALIGDRTSRKEEKALARIETALKAAEAERLAQQAREAEARAEAERKREEAARAEAQKKADEAKAKRKAAEAEAKREAAEAEAKRAAEAQKAAEAAAAAAETTRICVVKPGDTLSGIAKQMYGKAGRWPDIFEANRDRIKKANLIRPGWELRIPD